MSFKWSNVADNETENCVYYNTTTHKIILDTYNGIPQNLILNLVAWVILVGLFTILRKRAGNYGRIALVQKPEDNLKWRELFYGQADDAAADDRTDSASLDSNTYHDKGTFSWIRAIFTISSEQIVAKCGQGAAQYLSFQKHVLVFMFIMMCTSIVVVLPINFQGNLEGDENNFGHTTVNNLEPGSKLLWIHVTISIIYLPLAIAIMRRFSVQARISDSKCLPCNVVMITHIPRKRCCLNDIHQHLREAYPDREVLSVTLAYDAKETIQLDRDREKMGQARDYSVKYLERTQQRLLIHPYRCGLLCGRSACCNSRTVDAIEWYTRETDRLETRRDEAKEAAKMRPLGIAFVTLRSEADAHALLLDLKRNWYCGSSSNHSSLAVKLKIQKWQASYAPEISDILWENLSPSRNWYFRAVTINFILFIVLFFLTTPAIVVNLINTPIFSDVLQKSFSPVISQFVPTLILWTMAATLPVLVSYSDQWLSHWTRSEKNYSIMVKTFVFLLFMVLILPSIGLTSAKAFIDWTWNLKNETFRWKCLFLPDKGAFFVNYVTTSTFIGTSLELIRFPELFVYAVRLCLIRSRAESASVRKDILWDFPFGVQYAWMLLIFAMTTVYSLSCPLITPFGFLYVLLKHGVDKHNLYFVYSPSKINSEIHSVAINCVMFSVVLVQASFLALSVLRSGMSTGISIYALIGFVFTILSFLFSVFFSCCKGFSPISYVRRADASPSHTSTWFVPDVLSDMNAAGVGSSAASGSDTPDISIIHTDSSVLYQHNATAHLA